MSSIEPSPEFERVESPFARRRAASEGGAASAEPARPPARPAPREAGTEKTHSRVLAARATRTLDGLRAMTGYEEQLVEDRSRWENTSKLCNEVLARCLCSPGSEPDDASRQRVLTLSVAERDAALIQLRRMTFGDGVASQVDCPRCSGVNEIAFDLKQLTFDIGEITEQLEVTLWDGRCARLRLPNAADQTDLLQQNQATLADRRSWLLARCTQELDGAREPFDVGAVHAWDSRTRRELESELEAAIPDLDLRMRVSCSHCEHDFSAPFQIESFFLPS